MQASLRTAILAFLIFTVAVAALGDQSGPKVEQRELQSSLANAPSVKLHVTFKPDGTEILYDGFSTFVEDDSQFKYMLVDGVGYLVESSVKDTEVQTVTCLPAVMPFDSILPAFNDATLIPSASIGGATVECSSGNLFKTSFGGASFAVCASGASGFIAHSSDMTIEAEYLDAPVSIIAPKLDDDAKACSALATAISITPTALALLTSDEIPASTSRNLKAASHMAMTASKCECKSTPRPCIFLHGLGNPSELDELQDSPRLTDKKFGSIKGHAPCCSTVKYAVLNTVDYPWTDDILQEKYCRHSLSVSNSSDLASATIADTIIVTHSMGGLVLAGALATGKCKFGINTSWVALSTPMTGSMAADYLQDFCNDETSNFVLGLFELLGQCPMSISRRSTVYQGEKYSTPELDAKYIAAQQAYGGNVAAAMCSDYYVGLFSTYQAPCILSGTKVPHKTMKNDGLVEFDSCAVGLDVSRFGTSYLDRFYMPELNHADTAFLTGEGILNDYQKPHKWFECLL
ncbi:hypothetical protein BBJ29_009560 [Phytophthora kernoviae]|uniref:GPI inositol-deacylase n=1 Tax=Phytophthora kernoviae TaxID=325452 RepID=A0A3F2RCW2_9STRA|nr:hypothetical protein BBP00_00009340 [Phytophthora kernoviae]RLN70629.1 hypothetical protein BBJ29_009560 [Phytophthora kernoviae]